MSKRIKLATVCATLLVVLAVAVPIVFAQSQALPKTIGIATHPKGSTLNLIGTGVAKVINSHLQVLATDRPFTGYIAWLPLLNRGEIDMGVITSTDCHYGYEGLSPYREKLSDLRLVSAESSLKLGFVAAADAGIKTISGLKKKRVSIDKASASTRIDQETVLKAAGLDLQKDITIVFTAGVAEAVYSVQEGRADTGWASVGMGPVRELISKVGSIYWIPLCESPTSDAAKLIMKTIPGVDLVPVKAGTEPTVSNDTLLMNRPIYFVSHKKFGDEAVYQIVKTIWHNHQELVNIHPTLFKGWTNKMMAAQDPVIPYHSGAIRFYKEVGAWSDKMEEAQKRLLPR